MELKDILLIMIAVLGWTWGVIQYFINRRNQRKDKESDRKYLAYSKYMTKADEVMNSIRTDPNMVYGITTDFLKTILNENDEKRINEALVEFNENLLGFTKKASEPLLILRQELNSLRLICSDQLELKIAEFNELATDYNNEFQNVLGSISATRPNEMAEQLETIGHDDRWKRFESLNKEIIDLMRQEIS